MNLVLATSGGTSLDAILQEAGVAVSSTVSIEDLKNLDRFAAADVLILDTRGLAGLPAEAALLKRRHTKLGILLIVPALDPRMMLEAMRAGVTEVIVDDPASAADLRQAVERLAGQFVPHVSGEVIAFVGAKGGVGTTTMAANVATALAADHKAPVALVDLHITSYGDAALQLGVEPKFSVADALENVTRLDEAYLDGVVERTAQGVDVLASPEQPAAHRPDQQRVKTLLQCLADQYRWVVLDVPHGDVSLFEALDPLSALMLVVTQDVPAVRLATRLARRLQQQFNKNRLGIVINKFDSGLDIGAEDVQKAIGLNLVSMVPIDIKRAIFAANAGKPVISDTNSRLSPALKQLAGKFSAAARPDTKPAASGKGIVRLAGLF